MSKSLLQKSTSIFGGSAVAGMGFAFGRDVYKDVKKDLLTYILFLVIFLSFVGTYMGGIWMARNYKSIWGSIFARIGAIIVIIPTATITWGAILGIGLGIRDYFRSNEQVKIAKILGVDAIFVYAAIVVCVIFIIGLLVGISQRIRRGLTWDAEIHNELFMKNNSLIEHEDSTLEDTSTGQNYRVESIGKNRITLFALGRRSKRGYINITEGKYDHFSGIVSL